MLLIWNDWNVSHIARHGVLPDEAEEVLRAVQQPYPEICPKGKFLVWGQTRAGRYLQVVYIHPPDEEIDYLALSFQDRVRIDAGDEVGYVMHAPRLGAV